jgi:hypothetical protein
MKRTAIMLTIALITTACGPSANNFNTKYAKAYCSAYEECAAMYFNDYFSSKDNCVATYMDYYDEDEYYDGCAFDRGVAKEILKAMKDFGKSCDYSHLDTFVDDAWSCGGGRGGGGNDSSFDTAW